MFKIITLTFTFIFMICLASEQVLAQEESTPAADEVAGVPEDPHNRGTPRQSLAGFLLKASELDFEAATEHLDLRHLPPEASDISGPELARQLNFVLSRSVWLDDYAVNDTPDGARGDGFPDYRDELARINTKNGEVLLFMQHVPRSDGVLIWQVSNRSLGLVPALYEEFGYPTWIESIRTRLPDTGSFLGLETFKWVIGLSVGLISWPILYLFGLLLSRLFSKPANPNYPLVRKVLTGPVVGVGIILTMNLVVTDLGLSAVAQQAMKAQTLLTAMIVWLFWSVANLIRNHHRNRLIEEGRPGAAQLLRPMTTLIKMLVLLAGILFWMNNLGINISTVLAGLGVGGLALALALQKPLEDLMGALTLFSQAPVRVGDFCRYGTITGVVEDIGLRTTRIRTLADTLVSIPNSRIALVEIENFSLRNKVHYKPVIRLRYDTLPDEVNKALVGIRQMLDSHPRVLDDPQRVRFTDFESDAILIEIHAYIDTVSIAEFLEISEELNLLVVRAIDDAGARFALPSRSLHIEEKLPVSQ